MTSPVAVSDRSEVLRTERQQERLRVQDDKRTDIAQATQGVQPQQLNMEASRLASSGDDYASAAVTGTGAGAHRYSAIDPTRGQGIRGVPLSDKVKGQMQPDPHVSITEPKPGEVKVSTPDTHKFPRVVDGMVERGSAKSFPVVNGDGSVVSGMEQPGALNGKQGKFQYTVNNGEVNHRQFIPEGARDPIDASRRIPGTNIARYAGRAMLAAGALMDGYEIATADNKPRKIAEKAGAWGTSLGAASVVGQAAAPLLAAGPVGWAGYGVAVVGAGIGGYIAGSRAGTWAYDTVSGWFK